MKTRELQRGLSLMGHIDDHQVNNKWRETERTGITENGLVGEKISAANGGWNQEFIIMNNEAPFGSPYE